MDHTLAVRYHSTKMISGELFGLEPTCPPVWAGLCTGRADGSNARYLVNAKHAILAMVRSPESEVESTIQALLKSNGWRETEIQKVKVLDQPFNSDGRVMCARYERAIKKQGGIVVYADPIPDA